MGQTDDLRHHVQSVEVRSLNIAYLEKGSGPLVLCLHGYPDTAYSWIQTLHFLAERGFRAVAPFMRGYYPSDIPSDGDYSVQEMARDALALIDALGAENAIIIGHDWGALAALSAVAIDASKVSNLITLDMIHPATLSPTLTSVWKGRHIIAYQRKNASVKHLKRNNFAHIDEIYRRWSPNWDFAGETDDVKHAFAQPGRVEAALGYYWAFAHEARHNDEKSKLGKRLATTKIEVPTLALFGDWGAMSDKQLAGSSKGFLGPYQYVKFDGVGHFLHREAPEKFFTCLTDFLDIPKEQQ